jgi:hypothetical protein
MSYEKPATATVVIVGLLGIGVVAAVQLATTVSTLDPKLAGTGALAVFFTSLWFLAFSLIALVLSYFGYRSARHISVGSVIRRAALVASATIACLLLSSNRSLTLLEFIGIVIGAVLIEFYFQADRKLITSPSSHDHYRTPTNH